jgi:hypothetical protein
MKMQTIMEFNLSNLSEDVWISNLAKNPGLSILVVDGFGKLVLLHNVSYFKKIYSATNHRSWVFAALELKLRFFVLIQNRQHLQSNSKFLNGEI